MKAISQFIVHVCDLVEAEGSTLLAVVRAEARHVHAAVADLAVGAAFLVVSIPLFIAAAWLLATAFMSWLQTQVSPPAASALTGLLLLLAAALCLFTFNTFARRRRL